MTGEYETKLNVFTILIEISIFVVAPAIAIGIFAPAVYARAYAWVVGTAVLCPVVGIDFGPKWALLELALIVCFLLLLFPI